MLVIRDVQMQQMAAERRADFDARLHEHLTAQLPRHDAAAVRELASEAIARGAGFGLASERDIAGFAEVTGRTLGAFPRAEFPVPALAILLAHGLDPALKLARYEAWAQAQAPSGSQDHALR